MAPRSSTRKPAGGDAASAANSRRRGRGGIRTGLRNHQEVAVDSLDRLLRSPGSSSLTWMVIAIALALPLCLLLMVQNLQQFGSDVDAAASVSLFMDISLQEDALGRIQSEIEELPGVVGTDLITQEEALTEFAGASGFGDVLQGLDENPLPPVIVVSPATGNVDRLAELVTELTGIDGVDDVQLDLAWLQRLYGILDLARRLTLLLGILLCVGVALVVGNTVRLAIESRRDEIIVVKLVGGTDSYVARPFLYTGLWYGAGGGLLACLLLLLAQFGLQGPVSSLAGLYDGDFRLLGLDISGVLLVMVSSGSLGWAGAWLSVIRHLKAIEPR